MNTPTDITDEAEPRTRAVAATAEVCDSDGGEEDFDAEDFDEEESFDCGMTPDGCMDAGSEHCEFDCPLRRRRCSDT